MKIGSLDLVIFVAYFGLVMFVGLVSSKRGKQSAKDYFLAGEKLPWWLVAASLIAANQSTHSFVGMTGSAYEYGLVTANMILLAIPYGQTFLAWLLIPLYMKTGAFTLPQFMEARYDGRSRLAFGIITAVSHVVVEISTVLYLGGLALTCVFGEQYLWWGVGALSLMTGIYTIRGGLRSVVWTEVVQLVLLFTSGFVLAFIGLEKAGGLRHLMATRPEQFHMIPAVDHPAYPLWGSMTLPVMIMSFFYWGSNQFLVQRPLGARNPWHARMGIIGASYLTLLVPVCVVLPGIAASALFKLPKGDMAYPTLVEKLLPSGLAGLVLAGLIAGMMSHVAGALNSASTILTVDFYKRFFRKEATDAQMIRFGKIAGLVALVLATLWAPLVGKAGKLVFIYILDSYNYFSPGIVTAFFLGIFWKRGNGNGSLAAILITVPVSLAIHFLLPQLDFWSRTFFAFLICMFVHIVVSLATTPPRSEKTDGLIWSRALLKEAYPKGMSVGIVRNPLVWWLLVNVIVVVIIVAFR